MAGTSEIEIPETLKLHNSIYRELVKWWTSMLAQMQADHPHPLGPSFEVTLFTKMSAVALSQYAAVLAIDMGMNEEQFVKVSRANFQEAYERAPKFGD